MEGKWKHSFHQGEDVNTTSHINEYIKLQMKKYEIKCSRISNTSWKRNYFANLQIKSWNAFYCIYISNLLHFISEKNVFARWRKIWITWYSWMMRSPLSTNNEPVSTVNFQTLYVLHNDNIIMQIEWKNSCWYMKHLICELQQ